MKTAACLLLIPVSEPAKDEKKELQGSFSTVKGGGEGG